MKDGSCGRGYAMLVERAMLDDAGTTSAVAAAKATPRDSTFAWMKEAALSECAYGLAAIGGRTAFHPLRHAQLRVILDTTFSCNNHSFRSVNLGCKILIGSHASTRSASANRASLGGRTPFRSR